MTGSRRAEDAVLTYDEFLDTVSSTNLCNQLHHFRIVEPSISTNDKEGTFNTFWDREKDRSDEGLRIVGLLEDSNLLSKTRCP